MKPTAWQRPILVEPRFGMGELRLPLSDAPPETMVRHYRLPARFASDFGAYIAEDKNELVVCDGPLLLGPATDEATALCELSKALAALLPDMRLVCHDESGVNGTFTEGLITDITVRAGTATISRHPVQGVIPRARYYDPKGSGQDFETSLWLLLSLSTQLEAPNALLEHCVTEVRFDIDARRNQAAGGMNELWDTIPIRQALAALAEQGCEVSALKAAIDEVERRPREQFAEWLRTVRRPSPESPSDLGALKKALGRDSELATILATVGPGMLPGDLELWPVAKILSAIEEPELVAIGQCKEKRVFLDMRFQPAPVVIECIETLALIEEDASLCSLLLWHARSKAP